MTERIAETFARCRAEGRTALIGYLTAYDPDADGSWERIEAACEAGLDLLELGVPFSDPTADGPVIQAGMVRALGAGARLERVLTLARRIRERFELPIVLFSYANPLLRAGPPPALVERLAAAGVDGVLVVDLPPESAAELRTPARAAGLDWISLVAPGSTPARLEQAAAAASGFVYVVSLRGVTGAPLDTQSDALAEVIGALRPCTRLPIAVGFGIRTPEQAQALHGRVDGVVVGTALIRAGLESPAMVGTLVTQLRGALC